MAEAETSDGERPRRRRWSFADCVFDEANWTLTVAGARVAAETKPLELLRELLLRAGDLATKDDLLNAVWPDVIVVEASLPTAVSKLRSALGCDRRPTQIIETVPRIGYRLAVPVRVEEPTLAASGSIAAAPPAAANDDQESAATTGAAVKRSIGRRRIVFASGALALALGATAIALTSSQQAPATEVAPSFSRQDAMNAIRRLDVGAIERMLAAGWNPNAELRGEGNAALHYAVEMCEWDRGHDQERLVLMVRTLYEGGGHLDQRNVWGDTPYSIAKAPRYCGPNHPVTRSLQATCSNGGVVMDHCLASYEIARRRRG